MTIENSEVNYFKNKIYLYIYYLYNKTILLIYIK